MGRIIRLRNHTDEWLSSIDDNIEVALNKVENMIETLQSENISHKKIIKSIDALNDTIETEIRDLKS